MDWLMTVSPAPLREAMPHIPTSDNADAWLIGAWSRYWHPFGLDKIKRSRGHSFKVAGRHMGELVVEVIDPYDHREGVKVKRTVA